MANNLTVEITGEALELLQNLADRSGNELAVELKRAVADRHYLIGKLDEGNRIVLEAETDFGPMRTFVDIG